MDNVAILIIIIGIIGSVFDKVKKSRDDDTHKKNSGAIGSFLKKIPIDKLEGYVDNELLDDVREVIGQKKKEPYDKPQNNIEFMEQTAYNQEVVNNPVKKKKKKKSNFNKKDIDKKVIVHTTTNISKPKNNKKKNPFELTKNPVTNAIIASEILGKPKCKK